MTNELRGRPAGNKVISEPLSSPNRILSIEETSCTKSAIKHIQFWFDSIHCFCKDTSTDHHLNPPVILVCTGTDKINKSDLKAREETFRKQINSIAWKNRTCNHKRKICFISNTEYCEDDFKDLKNEIAKIAKEMDYFAEKLPTRWIQLEIALSKLTNSKKINILSLKEVADLARHLGLIQKEKELFVFLNYQHQIGNIIFFKDISDYIILQPNWLVKCFRCLVCDNQPHKRNENWLCSIEMSELEFTGKLSENLIVQLFEKEPTLEFDKHKDHLLKVMEKFDIIIKPTLNRKSGDECQKSYYVPCMISHESKLDDIKNTFGVAESHCTPWLVIEFDFLPTAYFNHIMFNYIANYEVCEGRSGEPAIYCGKAVFWLDEDKSNILIICFSHNAISIQIWKWEVVTDDIYTNIIYELCNKIEQLIKDFGHNISYDIKAKCSLGNYADASGRISLHVQLHNIVQYRCEEHNIMHNTDNIIGTWLQPAIAESNIRQNMPHLNIFKQFRQ
ncbi:unnamed protein product [Mytilus edulis]|uniref:COR domain-containing protein n=1 Tax=Mytilus edulis TaxID=6550 RepID=A0A8S3S4I6_MYTED|nr:unnamed protein product [Mytilus edulis]